MCSNGQSFRLDVTGFKLLTAIRTELLSDASVERFKSKLVRRLRRANVDTGRIRKLEGEVANIVESIAQRMRSPALLARLQ